VNGATDDFRVWTLLRGAGLMQLSDIKLGQHDLLQAETGYGPVQVIAVAGGKSGIGKTSLAVNLALALAKEGQQTMLLDADFGMGHVDAMLGLEAESGMQDVLNGKRNLQDIIITGPDGLMVMPSISNRKAASELGFVECAGVIRAFSDLDQNIDTLVIDTASGISESVASFCRASSEVLIVTTSEPASFQDSIDLIRLLHSGYGITHFRLLANRVRFAQEAEEIFRKMVYLLESEHAITVSYAGYIPVDDFLREAAINRQAVVDAYPRCRASMAIRNLARRVMGWPSPVSPGGHIEFFVERLIQHKNVGMEVVS